MYEFWFVVLQQSSIDRSSAHKKNKPYAVSAYVMISQGVCNFDGDGFALYFKLLNLCRNRKEISHYH